MMGLLGVVTGMYMDMSEKCVCNLVFLSRYMRPKGTWQRRSRCPRATAVAVYIYDLFPGTSTGLASHRYIGGCDGGYKTHQIILGACGSINVAITNPSSSP